MGLVYPTFPLTTSTHSAWNFRVSRDQTDLANLRNARGLFEEVATANLKTPCLGFVVR